MSKLSERETREGGTTRDARKESKPFRGGLIVGLIVGLVAGIILGAIIV